MVTFGTYKTDTLRDAGFTFSADAITFSWINSLAEAYLGHLNLQESASYSQGALDTASSVFTSLSSLVVGTLSFSTPFVYLTPGQRAHD